MKFNDLVFSGTNPLNGNLIVVTGNVPYKVLADLLEKCGVENVASLIISTWQTVVQRVSWLSAPLYPSPQNSFVKPPTSLWYMV